jgi:hypothetical protein
MSTQQENALLIIFWTSRIQRQVSPGQTTHDAP